MAFSYDDNDDVVLKGGTDGTPIGNVGDRAKVIDEDVIALLTSISLGQVPVPDIYYYGSATSSRTETDVPGTTYTVVGSNFALTAFLGSYNHPGQMTVRLRKQIGGAGPWIEIMRLDLLPGGQGGATPGYTLGSGIRVAGAGDKLKLTSEGTSTKGTVWAAFAGREY